MPTPSSIDTRIKAAPLAELCSSELKWDPWAYDASPGKSRLPVYGAGASQWDAIPVSAPVQGEIPERYRDMPADEVERRIAAAKAALGSRLVILGHHYQRDEIIRWADFRGDSFKLSQQAAGRREADYIVFCGVHFMAESADILAGDHQRVILPNLAAGCSMADMADEAQVLSCWKQLDEALDLEAAAVIPVTYMNSSAALKAFCGERGGVVCTSSNATRVLEWAFERGERVLFFPDEHLGRNTGVKLDIPDDAMVAVGPAPAARGQLRRGPAPRAPDPLARLVLGARALHGGPDRRGAARVSGHHRDRAPGVPARGGRRRRPRRLDRVHPRDDLVGCAGEPVGGGNRDQHGQPAGRRAPGQADLLPRPRDLSVLDHVSHSPGVSGLGAGGPGRRPGAERDRRARWCEGGGPRRARPHALAPWSLPPARDGCAAGR